MLSNHTGFIWRPDQHQKAPKSIKQAVLAMAMIRALVAESPLSQIPNEVLFGIFVFLQP